MIATLNSAYAQEEKHSVEIFIDQDLAQNISGGLRTGSALVGLNNLDFNLSTEEMNLWENGRLRFHIQNTYGETLGKSRRGYPDIFQYRIWHIPLSFPVLL